MADKENLNQPVVAPGENATDADKANSDAIAARQKAVEAQKKADDTGKSAEQRKADSAAQEADDAKARAAQADRDAHAGKSDKPMTVEQSAIVAPHVPPETLASDVRAVKRGNDPANPMPARGEHGAPELMTVKLERVTPDLPDPVVAFVHPEMVGDYLRAGWSKSEA